jgi:hypothetical protein
MFNIKKLTDLLSQQRDKLESTFGIAVAKGIKDEAKKEMANACKRNCTRKLRDTDRRA